MASASITTAPRSRSIDDTVDLPDPMPPVSPTSSTAPSVGAGTFWSVPLRSRPGGDDLTSVDPAARLAAASALKPRHAERLRARARGWPPLSPGSLGAWLLLVTTKPPHWRDPLLEFPEQPLTAGHPHEGWFYPDPVGFWAEARRWATVIARTREPSWTTTEALSVSALVHLGEEPGRLDLARSATSPRVVLLLDEQAARAAGFEPADITRHHVPDPHRDGQVYQGWWGRLPDTTIVGKAPQHPSAHRLYRPRDMDGFLSACPV